MNVVIPRLKESRHMYCNHIIQDRALVPYQVHAGHLPGNHRYLYSHWLITAILASQVWQVEGSCTD